MASAPNKHMNSYLDSMTANNTSRAIRLDPIPPMAQFSSPIPTFERARTRLGADDLESARPSHRAHTMRNYNNITTTTTTTPIPELGELTELKPISIIQLLILPAPMLSLIARLIVFLWASPYHEQHLCKDTLFEPFYRSVLQCIHLDCFNVFIATVVLLHVDAARSKYRLVRLHGMVRVLGPCACVSLALWLTTLAAVIYDAVEGVRPCRQWS